jgi:hypothetical protein
VRSKAVALRVKVEAYNEQLGLPGEDPERVIAYVGQTLLGGAEDDAAD